MQFLACIKTLKRGKHSKNKKKSLRKKERFALKALIFQRISICYDKGIYTKRLLRELDITKGMQSVDIFFKVKIYVLQWKKFMTDEIFRFMHR